jgi:hypothetical protein
VNPLAVRAMAEVGIDISHAYPKAMDIDGLVVILSAAGCGPQALAILIIRSPSSERSHPQALLS